MKASASFAKVLWNSNVGGSLILTLRGQKGAKSQVSRINSHTKSYFISYFRNIFTKFHLQLAITMLFKNTVHNLYIVIVAISSDIPKSIRKNYKNMNRN